MKTRKGWLVKRGKTYHAAWKIGGKLFTKSTGQTDKRNALTRLAEIMEPFLVEDEARTLESVKTRLEGARAELAAIDEARNPPPQVKRIWGLFLDSPGRPDSGEATLRKYEPEWSRFTAWLARTNPDIEHLAQVTPAMAADYARDMTAAKLSASTFNQHRNLLRMVWRVMADECRLTANPWDKIMPRKLNSLANRKRALTPGQFDSLLAAVETDPDLHDLFTLLAWTGLRLADGVLMKWGSVDFARRVISLAPIKTARRQGKIVHIPMFPAALDVLNRRQEGKPINLRGLVFPALAAVYERDTAALSKRIAAAFNRAGMETTEERADRGRSVVVFGAHSCRHFFVSAATAAGMPGAMIKSITGHGSDGMLEHYQHLGVDLAADLAGKIGNGTLKALPPADPATEIRARVKAIAEGMTTKTWKAARAELLALAGKE
jgi:integrase